MRKWGAKNIRERIAARRAAAKSAAPAATESGRRRYTAEQLDFLRAGYQTMQVPELTAAFSARFGLQWTKGQIKGILSNHKITCGRAGGNRKGTSLLFTSEQTGFIAEFYRQHTITALTAALNRQFDTAFSEQQIKSFIGNHRIRSGRTGCFKKGHEPWNAGTKGQGLTGPNKGSFRSGTMPRNKRRLWSERLNVDGYIEISVPERNSWTGAATRWKCKHLWIWEAEHGPLPDGHAVAFIDGDRTNITLDNLMLVSRAELLRLNQNGYGEVQEPLKPAVLALTKLEVKMFAKAKKQVGHLLCPPG